MISILVCNYVKESVTCRLRLSSLYVVNVKYK